MNTKPNNSQPQAEPPQASQPSAPAPPSKSWQDYARQFLTFFQNWFLKLKVAYKIILILFVAALLVLVLLAYLGIFGQQVADLMKQLVTRLMELVGSKKTGS
jgi:predicted PurR-regulated permease PerM